MPLRVITAEVPRQSLSASRMIIEYRERLEVDHRHCWSPARSPFWERYRAIRRGEVVVEAFVSELVNCAGLSQDASPVGIVEEPHQAPRKVTTQGEPPSCQREGSAGSRQDDQTADGKSVRDGARERENPMRLQFVVIDADPEYKQPYRGPGHSECYSALSDQKQSCPGSHQ